MTHIALFVGGNSSNKKSKTRFRFFVSVEGDEVDPLVRVIENACILFPQTHNVSTENTKMLVLAVAIPKGEKKIISEQNFFCGSTDLKHIRIKREELKAWCDENNNHSCFAKFFKQMEQIQKKRNEIEQIIQEHNTAREMRLAMNFTNEEIKELGDEIWWKDISERYPDKKRAVLDLIRKIEEAERKLDCDRRLTYQKYKPLKQKLVVSFRYLKDKKLIEDVYEEDDPEAAKIFVSFVEHVKRRILEAMEK